jgi:hypothetical protein
MAFFRLIDRLFHDFLHKLVPPKCALKEVILKGGKVYKEP